MTKRIVRLLLFVFLALTAIYVGYQVYSGFSGQYATETATLFTVSDGVDCIGVAVRNEKKLETSTQGVKEYLIDDGEKVGKNALVANVYASVEAAMNNLSLTMLKQQLELLSSAADAGRSGAFDMEAVSSSLYDALYVTADAVSRDSLDGKALERQVFELTRLLNNFASASGERVDYSAQIEAMKAKIENSPSASPIGSVYSDADGYFVSSADGMEDVVDMDGLLELSADEIIALTELTAAANADECKIVDGYIWYFAAVIDAGDAERFSQGSSALLDFEYALIGGVPGVVKEIKTSGGGNKAVVIFECDYLNSSLASIRIEQAEISFRNYRGIRIDRRWLRTENGTVGVYVRYGSEVLFKPLLSEEIIYQNDDYMLLSSDGSTVALYDEIITSGKDLYAGKQLK